MSEKKHIDRLFQEKLKDFEATPDDAIWEKIHDRLHEDKRKRRVIPIWWRVAGVAALLALLLTVGVKLIPNNSSTNPENSIVGTEQQSSESIDSADEKTSNNSNTIEKELENSSKVAVENNSSSETESNFDLNQKIKSTNKTTINQKLRIGSNTDNNVVITNVESDTKEKSPELYSDVKNNSNSSSKVNNSKTKQDAILTRSLQKEAVSNPNNPVTEKTTKEANQLIEDSENTINSAIANSPETSEEKIIEEKKDAFNKEQTIEEAIAETTTEDEKEKKRNRWSVSPNVAPVYFNTLGKGSTLDDQFVDNENSSEVTLSYGVGGSYAINDRLKVRAGINKVDMGYNTNNVIAYRNIDASSQSRSQLSNVDTNDTGDTMIYLSTESLNRNSIPEIINAKSEGSLNQRFGFIEIPMEVEYALIHKKFGVNVISGFSALIVDTNEIYSVLNGTETNIGEAKNINTMSYSANLGLGINYNISDKIKVNVEPTFKYQINTFNNSSGDFQPYFIGVYTGLSYKF